MFACPTLALAMKPALGACLFMVAVTSSSTGRALPPYPIPDCGGGWWIERTDIPLVVTDAPSSPTVLLPVEWSPSGAAADVTSLEIEVVDSRGQVVAGAVRYDPREPPFRVARWTPASPLALGEHHELTVRVPAPPEPPPPGCPFVAFERTIAIDTGAGSTSPGALVIVSLEARDTVTRRLEVGESVCGGWAPRCENAPEICCRWVEERRHRAIVGEVVADTVSNGEPMYNAIRATIYGLPDGPGESVFQAVAEGGTYWPYDEWMIESGQPVPSDICMSVALIDLLWGEATAEAETCGLTTSYEMHPFLPWMASCPDSACPGGASPADAVAETHDSVGACAGGPTGGSAALWVLALFVALRRGALESRPTA